MGPQICQQCWATSKLYDPKQWHEASSVMRTHTSGVTCDPQLLGAFCLVHVN